MIESTSSMVRRIVGIDGRLQPVLFAVTMTLAALSSSVGRAQENPLRQDREPPPPPITNLARPADPANGLTLDQAVDRLERKNLSLAVMRLEIPRLGEDVLKHRTAVKHPRLAQRRWEKRSGPSPAIRDPSQALGSHARRTPRSSCDGGSVSRCSPHANQQILHGVRRYPGGPAASADCTSRGLGLRAADREDEAPRREWSARQDRAEPSRRGSCPRRHGRERGRDRSPESTTDTCGPAGDPRRRS